MVLLSHADQQRPELLYHSGSTCVIPMAELFHLGGEAAALVVAQTKPPVSQLFT